MTNKLLHYTERDVFRIKDIATKFNTTIDDVLHIANDKHIVLEYLVKSKRNIILAVPEFYQDKNGMMVESYGEYRSIYLKTGDRMDLSVDAIKQLMANQFFYEGDNMGHSLYNDGFVVANNVDQGEKITIDDLIIAKNSIDKLSALLKNDTPEHISKSEASKQEQRVEWLHYFVQGLVKLTRIRRTQQWHTENTIKHLKTKRLRPWLNMDVALPKQRVI